MMLNAAGVDSLNSLITFMEYMSVGKNRIKELKELRDAHKAAVDEREAVEKAHGGAKALAEADKTLADAQTTASNTIAKAETEANELVDDAHTEVGELIGARAALDVQAKRLVNDIASFDKTSAATIKELERREVRASKKENDNSRTHTELVKDRQVLQEKSERVINALKG